MTTVQTLGEQLAVKRSDIKSFIDGTRTDAGFKMTPAQIDELKAKRTETEDLQKQLDTALFAESNEKNLADLKNPVNMLRANDGGRPQVKSLGERVTEDWKSKNFNGSGTTVIQSKFDDVNVKTLMSEAGTGYAPPNYRTDIVVLTPQRIPVVMDLIPQAATDLTSIKYMLETTYTSAAAARAEGAAFAQSALGYAEQNTPVQSLAHYIPVTEEQLTDVPAVQGLIDDRLVLMLQQKEEQQLLSGTGASNQLTGFLNATGINTYVQSGSISMFDAFLNAYTQVRTSGATAFGSANVTGVVLNPTDAQNMMLLRTTDGLYIMGNPGGANPLTIWGIAPTITNAIASGTALVGDFRTYAQIYRRMGITVEVGYQNDDFVKNQKTIRAQERLALAIYRPGAFSAVTLLNQ